MTARTITTGLAAVAALAVLASTAGATARSPAALTPAERNALRIVSVRALGADSVGMTVTVTFAGNVEQALGRGHLKTAVVAVLLRPKDAKAPIRGVATLGGGAIGQTYALHAKGAGVVRDGRRLFFFVPGSGSSSVAKVDVKAFAANPARSRSLQAAAQSPSPDFWHDMVESVTTDEEIVANVDADAPGSSCDQIIQWRSDLKEMQARVGRHAALFTELRPKIDKAIEETQAKINSGVRNVGIIALHTILAPLAAPYIAVYGESPAQTFDGWKALLRSLQGDRKLLESLDARNKALGERIAKLLQKLDVLAEEKCNPAPDIRIHAEFEPTELATHYTVITESPVTVRIFHSWTSFEWNLTPPTDDPKKCDNRGQITSEVLEFVWYHGDDVCTHGLEDARGHKGTVTVTVSDDMWRCSASIKGTATMSGFSSDCTRR